MPEAGVFRLSPMLAEYLPLGLYMLVAAAVGVGGLALSAFLGPRLVSRDKFTPYECGLDQLDDPHKPFPVKFYTVALLFMLFDIETIFLLPWAVGYLDFGTASLIAVLPFLGIVAIGMWYEIRMKVLEWD
jgi:NADH-quinone oxidoreductase subunit A